MFPCDVSLKTEKTGVGHVCRDKHHIVTRISKGVYQKPLEHWEKRWRTCIISYFEKDKIEIDEKINILREKNHHFLTNLELIKIMNYFPKINIPWRLFLSTFHSISDVTLRTQKLTNPNQSIPHP